MNDETLARSIGQLLCVGFHGTSPHDHEVEQLLEYIAQGLVGSVILFRHNIINPSQLSQLTSAILGASTEYPVWIMIDQEGGRVQRLTSDTGFSDFDSAKTVAATKSELEATALYHAMGVELASMGVNFNFAPSVDVDTIPCCPVIGSLERSFSSDPEIVSRYAECCVKGLRSAGVLSCLKHFPGHGSATVDSHKGLTDVTTVWHERELEPFRALILRCCADAIMMAHIIHREIDADTPASLSKVWHGMLRHEWGFDGVVISDDMHMGAIQQYYDRDIVIEKALVAGSDVLVFSNNAQAAQGVVGFVSDPALPEAFHRVVIRLLDQQIIYPDQLKQSLVRIKALKCPSEN